MQTKPANPDPSPVIVFGLDEKGKGHASRFEAAHAELAEKAAGMMGMKILRLSTAEDLALAAELPVGRVFASGKAFVPFVARSRFDRLAAAPGAFAPPCPPEAPAKARSKPKGGRSAIAGADGGPEPADAARALGTPPADWAGITVGSLALAAEEGLPAIWYVVTVVAQRGDDLFELRWLDDDNGKLPLIVRRREHLGLFPPALAGALA